MVIDHAAMLRRYAEVIVKVGVNLQPGQRLLIDGAPLVAIPLVRLVVECAYQAGARYVDVQWSDAQLDAIRYQNAPRDSFTEFARWRYSSQLEHIEQGEPRLSIWAANPDFLAGVDPDLVHTAQETAMEAGRAASRLFQRSAVNSTLVAAVEPAWAAKVYPGMPPEESEARLWEMIFSSCLLDRPDPVAAWHAYIAELEARCATLNQRRYAAVHLTGPGTDLTIGLPEGHLWLSCRWKSRSGIPFVCEMPADEIFTLPHRGRVEGFVTAARPRNYRDTLIEGARFEFSQGRVVKASAAKGEEALREIVATDEGTAHLGEIALVPASTKIAQSSRLFYNILFDENAGIHIALGSAYPFSLSGGNALSDEEFGRAGGNLSKLHLDFVVGSPEVDVDGLTHEGRSEAVMRRGEWAF